MAACTVTDVGESNQRSSHFAASTAYDICTIHTIIIPHTGCVGTVLL